MPLCCLGLFAVERGELAHLFFSSFSLYRSSLVLVCIVCVVCIVVLFLFICFVRAYYIQHARLQDPDGAMRMLAHLIRNHTRYYYLKKVGTGQPPRFV